MRTLTGGELVAAEQFAAAAASVALSALCLRSRCGSVIVSRSEVIGSGSNSLPGGCTPRVCSKPDRAPGFKSDRTCCVHAEQRAVADALRNNPDRLPGSVLYFVRLGADNRARPSGEPYCTICSKSVLDAGVSEFVLMHESGFTAYGTAEYNELSFDFGRYRPGLVLTTDDVPESGSLHELLGVDGQVSWLRAADGELACARPGCTELIVHRDAYYSCAYGSGAVHAWCADN